ncbi:MAG: sugar phosphate isomerase/epimerase [Lentisphaeria bacterium]|nr:sugar phosphate isomerase/epimerase [Lentisphaeria bacterium]
MKWGFTTLIAHRYSLEHCFREAAELGFAYAELNCVRGYYAHANAMQLADDPAGLTHVSGLFQKYGLQCSAVDCHGLFGNTPDEFRYNLDYVRAGLKVAASLRAPMLITSFPKSETPWERLVVATRELCCEAADLGLRVAVEAEYGYPVGTPEEVDRLFEEVDHPALGINFDPSHFSRLGLKSADLLRHFGGRVIHVHAKEYLPETPFPTRYTGRLDSPGGEMLTALAELGYTGVASAETLAYPEADPSEAMQEIMRGLQNWESRQ